MYEDILTIIINCPHCKEEVLIYSNEINCGIFRHGVFKENMQQIDPHLPEEYCKRLVNEDKSIGCGKPFSLTRKLEDSKFIYEIKECVYI